MANYTRQDVLSLDAKTIDFCARYLWDSLRRFQMTENDGKTKAAREYAKARNHGVETAYDHLRYLKQYATGAVKVADNITLWDDNPRGL